MQKIKLTKDAVESLRKEIDKKEKLLLELGKEKAHAAENEGDTWHDNFAFEQIEIKERGIIREISDLTNQLNTAEIIDVSSDQEKDVVNIGSTVKVTIKTSEEEEEEEYEFVLTGGEKNLSGIEYVSVNAPIGKCIFGKKVGFKGSYSINGNEVYVKILSVE